jgi:hypothetical protein
MSKKVFRAALLGAGATLALSLAYAWAETPAPAEPGASAVAAETPARPARAPSRRGGAEQHWAYQPVQHREAPEVRNTDWVLTPVDAFVLTKLEAEGIQPSEAADRPAFIRRATLDVWGVIPTPEEVDAFVNDASPDAYEKLVDRLLASPQYGVRQARRWLDLARYADSTGFEGDQTRPNNFRYRDYVVEAFNSDKPYDQFIREQIAGDELDSGGQIGLIATGFLAGYPDNRNSRDLVQRKYQIATDMTDTVSSVFLGQTAECARCHDHKFDPLSQKEYFQLQAFFANTVEVPDVPVANPGPVEQTYRAQMAEWQAATADLRAQRDALLAPLMDEIIEYQKQRYLVDAQASLFKPEDQLTAFDRWINHRWRSVNRRIEGDTYEADRYLRETAQLHEEETGQPDTEKLKLLEELRRLEDAIGEFDDLLPSEGSDTITAMTELGGAEAPATHVLFLGNHEEPLEEVQPGFPAAFANGATPEIRPTATSSGRRTALAEWIASRENPLTARVFVNRVWAQYFGTGIVKTVSNFGIAGERPTHPELLDYLAARFVEDGWSVKALHRQILLSNVYRQASDYREDLEQADPENQLLASFPRRRLEAEQIRDSLLAASGLLNGTLGGPSVFPPVPGNLNAGGRWRVSDDPSDFNRRSLYTFTRRSVPYPLLDVFDMASAQQAHAARDVTTTALQAMTLYNSDIVYGWSQALAGRVLREAGDAPDAQIDRLFEILFARTPDEVERGALLAFLDEHAALLRNQTPDPETGEPQLALPTGVEPSEIDDPVRAAALVDLVHTVANSNDFTYRF